MNPGYLIRTAIFWRFLLKDRPHPDTFEWRGLKRIATIELAIKSTLHRSALQ